MREIGIPEIEDDDVLLEVGAVSVCGSDVHQSRGTQSWPVNMPVVLGHEFGGTVAQFGRRVRAFAKATGSSRETAARICGECLMCRGGRYNLCPSRKGFGYGVDGAMARFVRVPARLLHHVPDSLPFDLACLAEPHAVAYNAMCVNSTVRPGDSVVVLGPGPIGLLCTRMAALSGANPLIVVGLTGDEARLDAARQLGATHTALGDVDDVAAIVRVARRRSAPTSCVTRRARATRSTAALRLARPDGHVIKVGWSPDVIPVDVNPLVLGNVRLQGSFSHNFAVWERVIHLLDSGVTHARDHRRAARSARGLARGLRRDARPPGHQVGAGAGGD